MVSGGVATSAGGGGGGGAQCFEELGLLAASSHLHVHSVSVPTTPSSSAPLLSPLLNTSSSPHEGGGSGTKQDEYEICVNPFGLDDEALRMLVAAEENLVEGYGDVSGDQHDGVVLCLSPFA